MRVLGGGSLRALAANRIEAATPPHARRSVARILIESRQVASYVAQRRRAARESNPILPPNAFGYFRGRIILTSRQGYGCANGSRAAVRSLSKMWPSPSLR